MTKTQAASLTPGSRLTVGGVEFAVLHNDHDGLLFVVAVKNQFTSRFGDNNNYAESDLREATEEWLKHWVEENHLDWSCITPREIDLTTLDGHKYGRETVTVAPLTMDEARQYAEFIPNPDGWSWLATGWDAPSFGAAYALSVHSNGDWYNRYCSGSRGVRPALVLSSELFPSEDVDRQEVLRSFTVKELLDELERRWEDGEQ